MFRNIGKLLRKPVLLPLLILPYTLKTAHNFWFWSNKKPNLMENRVHINVEISNKPCEDRNAKIQLNNVNGYAVAVFDGHGGWQVVIIFYN